MSNNPPWLNNCWVEMNLMVVVEEIQSQPDLISEKTWRLAEEARQCVESYASSLIEPPVRLKGEYECS